MDYNELIGLFFENSNKRYDDFNNKIINSGVKTIGCTVPFVRSVAKKHLDDLSEVVALPVHEYFEVDMFKGMVVSLSQLPFEQKRHYLLQFASTLENWAVCDSNTVKFPQKERELYFEFFCEMCHSPIPFVCRFGLVNLLSGFLDEWHINRVFAVLSQIVADGYYVDMAVAWLVATAMAKCRRQTMDFLQGEGRSVLNEFSYNKALQKIRDSFRVSNEDKQWTKTLKR